MNSSQRIQSVDIGRGFAIICMIAAHISIIFWVINDYGRIFAAPFFLLISGISYEFFLESRFQKKVLKISIFSESFSRSVIIYFLPLIPYFVVGIWGLTNIQVIHWGVFQVIALGYILGFFVHGDWKLKMYAIILVFLSTFLAQFFYPQILNFLLVGFTPLLPWLAYFFMGQLIFEIYQRRYISIIFLILISIIAFIFSFGFFYHIHMPFESDLRTEIPFFLLLSSLFFLIQAIFIILVDRLHVCDLLFNPLERIGKIAFTAYYLKYPLVFCAAFIMIKFNLPPIFLIPSIIIIMGILTIIEKFWEKYDYKFGFEWIVRRGSTLLYKKIISIFNMPKNSNER